MSCRSLSPLLLCAALVVGAGAQAQQLPSTGAQAEPAFIDATRQWLDEAVAHAQSLSATTLRMEVSLGVLDARLRLAPCTQVEPYLPVGTRLWGKTRLGLRCSDGGARWNVFLPVTVRAFGPAWVLRDNIAAGAELKASDAVEAEADWAAEASAVVADPAQWVGQTAARGLAAGQPLRQSMIRPSQVFSAGTQVRVIASGPGFRIVANAQALAPGVVGQPVRLRMDNGRMTTGVVQDAKTVLLGL